MKIKPSFFSNETILAFRVRRDDLECFGEHAIDYFIDKYNLFEDEEGRYADESGNDVGLTREDVKSGVGVIDYDGIYDTAFTIKLKDLDYRSNEIMSAVSKQTDAFTREQVINYFLYGKSEEEQDAIMEEWGIDN